VSVITRKATFLMNPMGAPRLPNKMRFSPLGQRYGAWKEELRFLAHNAMPMSWTCKEPPLWVKVNAHFPMPRSWSKKKRASLKHQLHRQLPDADNVLKAVVDALWKQDYKIGGMECWKYWADSGSIEIEAAWPEEE